MNKLRLIITILSIFSIFLCSCSSFHTQSATDILAELTRSLDIPLPAGAVYFDAAEPGSINYLSRADASLIYTGRENPDFDMLALARSYAVYMSSSLEVFEIHVFCATSYSAADALERMLHHRAAMLNALSNDVYFADALDGTPSGGRLCAEIVKKGTLVYMLVRPVG